jgi:hypothetical protein
MMREDMENQLDAERASGLSNTWRQVYQLMRCRDKSCKSGTHCLEDPTSQKHYPLTTHHLQSLIGFVNGGGVLRTERDIPEWFYKQLEAEEQLSQKKAKGKSPSHSVHETPCPPVNIVMPMQTPVPSSMVPSVPSMAAVTLSSNPTQYKRLDIPGSRDAAVKQYSEWHASKVDDLALKDDFRKACQVALENGLDLQQIVNRPDPAFFIEREVKIGTAYRFVDDITEWVEHHQVQMTGSSS